MVPSSGAGGFQKSPLLEPVRLRHGIPVRDVAFLVLERPGHHDHDVAFADPGSLFHRAFDAAHSGHAIQAYDVEVASSEQFCHGA